MKVLTVDVRLPGNVVDCSLCGKRVKADEDYFDYEYWGKAEIVHINCMEKEQTNEHNSIQR